MKNTVNLVNIDDAYVWLSKSVNEALPAGALCA